MTVDPALIEKAAEAIYRRLSGRYGDFNMPLDAAEDALEAVADDLRAEGAHDALTRLRRLFSDAQERSEVAENGHWAARHRYVVRAIGTHGHDWGYLPRPEHWPDTQAEDGDDQ